MKRRVWKRYPVTWVIGLCGLSFLLGRVNQQYGGAPSLGGVSAPPCCRLALAIRADRPNGKAAYLLAARQRRRPQRCLWRCIARDRTALCPGASAQHQEPLCCCTMLLAVETPSCLPPPQGHLPALTAKSRKLAASASLHATIAALPSPSPSPEPAPAPVHSWDNIPNYYDPTDNTLPSELRRPISAAAARRHACRAAAAHWQRSPSPSPRPAGLHQLHRRSCVQQ
jgi:hypothetical protein